MKKIISIALIFILTLSTMFCVSAANNEIEVYLDGTKIVFDVPPQIINGRTMVPIRAIFEAMGANVQWNAASQTAVSTKDSTTVTMTLNSTTEYINGTALSMDTAPVIIDGRTLAPARYVAEAFGYQVSWDAASRTVSITSSAPSETNSAAFEQLKSFILESGEKDADTQEYIYSQYDDTDDLFVFRIYGYDDSEDDISLYLSTDFDDETMSASFLMSLHSSLTLFSMNVTIDGVSYDYSIWGSFSDATGEFYIEDYEDMPEEMQESATNLLYSLIEALDVCLTSDTGLSLSSFGLSY